MSPSPSDPLLGRRFDDRYRVLSRIGRGGMGVVYRAEDERLDREVALKVLRADLAHEPEARQRFVREAKSAARLAHPGIVSVLDQGSDEQTETAYLVMELVGGQTLKDVIAEHGALTPRETLDVGEAVCDALAEAHRKGVLHRDVKPANVLVGDDGRVKVADFGLARAATAAGSTAASAHELMGTVEYLAPERVARGVADARSDVYGVGVLLFEMLTGEPPFHGDDPVRLAYRHVYDEAPAPSSLVPELPPLLDSVVAEALAKDPDDRPADAGALLLRLRAVRAALTPTELDTRPARAATLAGAPAVGATVRIDLDRPVRVGARPLGLTDDHDEPDHDEPDPLDEAGAERPTGGGDRGDAGVVPGSGEPAGSGRRRGRGGRAAVVVLLVLALAGGLSWFFLAGPGAFTTVPTLGTTDPAQAQTRLAAAGFQVDREQEFSDTVAQGQLIGTDPAVGDRVKKEGQVTVLVSRGKQRFTVPPVTGQTFPEARDALREIGLEVERAPDEFSQDVADGDVIRTDPVAGQLQDHDAPVTVVVSKGREPAELPQVSGGSLADAEQALRDARLEVVVKREFNEDVAKDDVISQTPDSGDVFVGDTVTLVVSDGPPLVPVPTVQGQQVGPATEQLRALGFQVRVNRVLGGIFGTVRDSSPAAGTNAPKGSTITLTVV
ncbi:Stk1 family PASTA domain-containing Ser/Thr kinase [Kineococcus gynurae]|uniref:non-specific serine/threonine protein kinase n=1 Tax=Kineococcus gynurae TaxID=452979 RepID=A0ABV5LUD7_9ACTN